jgi:hypothetical protein
MLARSHAQGIPSPLFAAGILHADVRNAREKATAMSKDREEVGLDNGYLQDHCGVLS